MTFRIKSQDDPAIGILFTAHNPGGFVPNLARIYGNDVKVVFAKANNEFIGAGFELNRINITELDREGAECSVDPALNDDGHPSRVLSPEGPKDLEDCIEDFYHSQLNCRLPWGKIKSSFIQSIILHTTTSFYFQPRKELLI